MGPNGFGRNRCPSSSLPSAFPHDPSFFHRLFKLTETGGRLTMQLISDLDEIVSGEEFFPWVLCEKDFGPSGFATFRAVSFCFPPNKGESSLLTFYKGKCHDLAPFPTGPRFPFHYFSNPQRERD